MSKLRGFLRSTLLSTMGALCAACSASQATLAEAMLKISRPNSTLLVRVHYQGACIESEFLRTTQGLVLLRSRSFPSQQPECTGGPVSGFTATAAATRVMHRTDALSSAVQLEMQFSSIPVAP